MKYLIQSLIFALVLVAGGAAPAAEVSVAVASNFMLPMQRIAQTFERQTGHRLRLSFGATGAFYAQIRNGAPFQVLLAADDQTPARLTEQDLAVPHSSFTYATGRLVLWSRQAGLVDGRGDVLHQGTFEHLALANPKLAPYGAAAIDTLTSLALLPALQPRFVQGENIAQTYQLVATGNAQLGFVALSQVYAAGRISQGSAWIVPARLHRPIRQDAVLLRTGQGNPAAAALLHFLGAEEASMIIRSFGYER